MQLELSDTTPEAASVQMEILRRLGPERRCELTLEWSEQMRQVALAGIRKRNPEYTERQVVLKFAKMSLGDELFQEAFGDEWAALS